MRTVLTFALLVAGASACGKKAAPDRPETSEATKPSAACVGLNEPSRIGDISITVTGAKLGRVPIRMRVTEGTYLSEGTYLALSIRVTNHSETKKLDYRRWEGIKNLPDFNDEHGNNYFLKNPGRTADGAPEKSVHPGESHSDVIYVEPPVKAATELRIMLPSLREQSPDQHCIKIPATAWK